MIYLVIYTAENCPTCQRVVESAKELANGVPNVELTIKNIKDCDRKITIVPAVFINQNLFCYGDFDKQKLSELIRKQRHLEN